MGFNTTVIVLNDTLSSQGSVVYVHNKGHHVINYTVEKWV